MRKLLLALVGMAFIGGLAIAGEVTIVKVDGKNVTIKDGDKEKVVKITDSTVVKTVDKDGNTKDGKLANLEKFLGSGKAEGKKMDMTINDKNEVTEVKMKGGKKKTN